LPISKPYTCMQTVFGHQRKLAKGVGSIHARKGRSPLIVEAILASDAEIVPAKAKTMDEAQERLSGAINMVICGIHFNVG